MLENLENEIDLLKRHLTVLKLVIENEPIGIVKLSELSGIPQHKVRYSLRVLEHRGLIKPSFQGAITTKKTKPYLNKLEQKLKHISKELSQLQKIL
ncbi:MAG: hypothetical protein DRN25_02130 [Thermoplasmata archaeon]|nr:MAG: hypothetical protein DRN25_02130 [Thermoplasmata archaeon]